MESTAPVWALEMIGLGHRYHGSVFPVIGELDLQVKAGEHLAVVGRSGCGKSTLLMLIAGLLHPGEGTVRVFGQAEAAARLAACALMPQGDSLLPWLSLIDNVAISLCYRGHSRRRARQQAGAILTQWGLDQWADYHPDELSGGMRQRAGLVRALLADKPVLLADEPLGALDAITRGEAQDWLRARLPDTRATLVLVTHDVEEALVLADRVVVLSGTSGGPASLVTEARGWFSDPRSRAEILADKDFSEARAAIIAKLAEPVGPAAQKPRP